MIIRILGVIVGLVFCFAGISLIIQPVFDTILEKLNAASFIVVGAAFVNYGFTKRSIIKASSERSGGE